MNNGFSHSVWSGNRKVEKILDWMYKDSTIYLDRKYKKYLQLKLLNQ